MPCCVTTARGAAPADVGGGWGGRKTRIFPPAMSRHIKSLKSEIDQGIRRLIRDGIQDGSIEPCDPKMTAFALAGALNWIAHWYREDQSLTGAQIAAAFVTIFEGGLRPRGSASQLTARASPRRRARRPATAAARCTR